MPEAILEVIRYLFEEVGLDLIVCGHFIWNTQSDRVQEKCGFRHYGFSKYETRINTIEDSEDKILTREMWEQKSGGNQVCPMLLKSPFVFVMSEYLRRLG